MCSSDLAAARNLKVAVEFMAYTSLNSIGKARELLSQAGQDNAGLCLDSLHFYRSGG